MSGINVNLHDVALTNLKSFNTVLVQEHADALEINKCGTSKYPIDYADSKQGGTLQDNPGCM